MILLLAKIDSFINFLAATSKADCDNSKDLRFFGIPTWYKYLEVKFVPPDVCKVEIGGDFVKFGLIGLAIVDMLLVLAGLVAVAFVIWGGIKYITSQGEPENTKNAQNTIINAVVGLVITMVAAAVVSFIGNRLG